MLLTDSADGDRLKIIEPYFRDEPVVETTGIDYVGKTQYEAKEQYWFVHTLSAIFSALISNNFQLELFEEYPHDISAIHKKNELENAGIPLSMTIVARKK